MAARSLPEVEAYCDRIGYAGTGEPTFAVLSAIVLAHTTAIAFENLDVLLKRPIRLDLPSLGAKLVRGGRGGYCFEQNTLLLDFLLSLGFHARGLAARVRWNRPPGVVGGRTHMLLLVDLAEGRYIADAGFGGLTPMAPLRLEIDCDQPTPHGIFRLIAAGNEFDLEGKLRDGWSSIYRFSLQEQLPVDYELANWFTSTHPNSLFTNHLLAGRADPTGHYALFNNRFTFRRGDGSKERRILHGAAEFGEVLTRDLRIAPLDGADLATVAGLAEERAAHPSPFDA
jgi:N-hydroxyarylamine O-acetyltransferase